MGLEASSQITLDELAHSRISSCGKEELDVREVHERDLLAGYETTLGRAAT